MHLIKNRLWQSKATENGTDSFAFGTGAGLFCRAIVECQKVSRNCGDKIEITLRRDDETPRHGKASLRKYREICAFAAGAARFGCRRVSEIQAIIHKG